MTPTMMSLPSELRPRERLWTFGADALSDAELLALLLHHGRAGESALDMASALLAEHGGVRGLASAQPEELVRRSGVGRTKAAALVAAFRLARRIAEPGQTAQSPVAFLRDLRPD
jgi:DNA repair protein RadC